MNTRFAWPALALVLATALPLAARAEAPAPSLADVQAAYARAETLPDSKHIRNMMIVGVACEPSGEKYSCQIGFRIDGEADKRVYLDVATVKAEQGGEWTLLSGLCRPR